MKIYVASYEDPSGNGCQKAFKSRKSAKDWLFAKFKKDYCSGYGLTKVEKLEMFCSQEKYGAFAAKVRQFTINY
jgi:hypothetical protein